MTGVNPWNRALVTGASSGIGRDLCRRLAKSGTDLVIVARRKDRLEDLAEELTVDVEILVADLSEPLELKKVEQRLQQDDKPVDLLINNAGIGNFGAFEDLNLEAERRVIDLNVVALHQLCYAAIKTMIVRKRGWILNVSSIVGFAPYPRSATYGGTKAFVTNFSESLQTEMAPKGIVISALCPGPVRTEFQQNAEVSIDAMPNVLVMESDEVAKIALEDLAKKKALIVPGIPMKTTRAIVKLIPAGMTRWASGFISSKRKL